MYFQIKSSFVFAKALLLKCSIFNLVEKKLHCLHTFEKIEMFLNV